MRIFVSAILAIVFISAYAQATRNGDVQADSDGTWQAWDTRNKEWVSIETFWSNYAKRKGGLTYGPTDTYPPYSEVEEYDTLLIELPQGNCLMEFFHRRWRRANDVRRWDPAFNEYGGCPYVFD